MVHMDYAGSEWGMIASARQKGREEGREEGRQERRKEGREEGRMEIAESLKKRGWSSEQIAEVMGMSGSGIGGSLTVNRNGYCQRSSRGGSGDWHAKVLDRNQGVFG
uniref:Uncharacterized protein n=1 Tax=Candidatus Kentrum sp. FW TaxID=2126338 RepID=A0A450U2H7_9GAMM|nr:MAG: hypothetical protein BECKFW1821C_GA0114237_11195 [Candidatus Kentron sp. FW]